ncbi:MAG TPA: maleylpyruvate isomerase family mycothiol-dependent enzyme, partial [Nocardioides sp.]|nr:maleylpyruvate isomerase family mycothiol-dependent enzyme [Nocardioides sp.]
SRLEGVTERAMARAASRPFPELVEQVREPALTPYRIPGVERLTNTLEYFVHHEDLRRAQPGWVPRELTREDEDELWSLVKGSAKLSTRKAGVPVVARRTVWDDLPPESATIRKGADPVVVTGRPGELVMFFFGRSELHDVTFEGPPEAIARLQGADRGF